MTAAVLDPEGSTASSRGPLYRASARVLGTRGPALLAVAAPTAVLRTVGAQTGRRRRHLVVYFHDEDRMTLVATRLGAADHPSWFHDALAHPEVMLGGRPFRAEVVAESDRERLWPLADVVFPPYATYRHQAARTGRAIPILHLVPR